MADDLQNGWGAQALDVNQQQDRYQNAIVSGCAVSDGTNAMEIDVASGEAIVAGSKVSVSATTLTLTSSNSDPRKDVVYIDSSGTPQVATGTAAPAAPSGETGRDTYQPQPPDLSATDAAVVAEVWVAGGASDTGSGDISDRRIFADAVFGSVTTDDLAGDYPSNVRLIEIGNDPAVQTIDPEDTTTPIQDAVDLTTNGNQSVIYVPPGLSAGGEVDVSDSYDVHFRGYGWYTDAITFPDNEPMFYLSGTFHASFKNLSLTSGESGTSAAVFRTDRNGTVQNGAVKDLTLDCIRVNQHYGNFFDVSAGAPFEMEFGQIKLQNFDAGDEPAIINWGNGGRAVDVDAIYAYPSDAMSASDSTLYSDTGGSDNSITFGWANLGGTLDTIADLEGAAVFRAINYEPTNLNSTTHDLFLYNGDNLQVDHLEIGPTDPTINSIYKLQGTGSYDLAEAWDRGAATISTSPVVVDGSITHGYYDGPRDDVTIGTNGSAQSKVECHDGKMGDPHLDQTVTHTTGGPTTVQLSTSDWSASWKLQYLEVSAFGDLNGTYAVDHHFEWEDDSTTDGNHKLVLEWVTDPGADMDFDVEVIKQFDGNI